MSQSADIATFPKPSCGALRQSGDDTLSRRRRHGLARRGFFDVQTFLRPGRRAQLRRQHRNVRAGALVFGQDALEVVQLVLADLRIGG